MNLCVSFYYLTLQDLLQGKHGTFQKSHYHWIILMLIMIMINYYPIMLVNITLDFPTSTFKAFVGSVDDSMSSACIKIDIVNVIKS